MNKLDVIKQDIISNLIDKFDTLEWKQVKYYFDKDTTQYQTKDIEPFTISIYETITETYISNALTVYDKEFKSDESYGFLLFIDTLEPIKDNNDKELFKQLKTLFNMCIKKYGTNNENDDRLITFWNKLRTK